LNRLDENRAISAISKKAGVAPHKIKNLVIWGSHGYFMYPDISFATVNNIGLDSVIEDKNFLKTDFVKKV